jgi:hypothetical protein
MAEETERTGSRLPDCSFLSKNRDIVGELGWVPNFEQHRSKFNDSRHSNYKEFFDTPKDDYHKEFISDDVQEF